MHRCDLGSPPAAPPPPEPPPPFTYPDLVLRTPPNWTAVGFIALLAALHLSVAARAFLAARWEGYVSLGFGSLLTVATVALFHTRHEVAVLYRHGRLRVRDGVGWLSAERLIPFRSVRAVRVTLGSGRSGRDSTVELVCHLDDVSCPATPVPGQLGLLLAMMIGVPLVKVSDELAPEERAAAPNAPASLK